MAMPSIPVPADERERLDACVREPIRRPGVIQCHGVLMTADVATWTVLQVSENCLDVLGSPAQEVIGSGVGDVLGESAVERFVAVLAGNTGASNPIPLHHHGVGLDAIIQVADGVIIVELERAQPTEKFSSIPAVYDAIGRLARLMTPEQLRENAAREVHRLTGFDRVMIYHFHRDGHGEVVAEQQTDDSMETYLGLHYPASDIPAQARALYLTKLSRTIASTDELGCSLVPAENPLTGEPLDLSSAELRSVSPHHVQFMRNMGQAATLSFSLIIDGELVGMITCAHRTPRRLPFALRQALEVFAGQVALLLGTMAEMSRVVRATELLSVRQKLVDHFARHGDLPQALQGGPVTMLDLVPAAAALIHCNGSVHYMGDPGDQGSTEQLVVQLRAGLGSVPIVSESLAIDYPALADFSPRVAGVLIIPFGEAGDYLAWFRPEVTETINWLGDQSESNRDSTLSPRNSFSAWSESVSGVAEPWGMLDEAARSLARDLDSARHRRTESTLAQVALHDALTGLPNRRLFMDRLEMSVAAHARGREVAVLFIDLDSFKTLNDLHGHEGGDAVLTHVAQRFLSVTRAADTVARLGGDEFAVVCFDSDIDDARGVAERLRASLSAPLIFGGHTVVVTASIGVAMAEAGDTAASLLRRADASMYRAKRGGKDQVA